MTLPPYLYYGLELTPKSLAAIVRRAGPEKYEVAPSAGRFTLRESVAHVLAWEPIFRARIEQAVSSSGSPIETFDEEKMPIERGYARWDVEDSLHRFAEERHRTVEYAKSLTPDEVARTVLHPRHGLMAVPDVMWMMLIHDTYHVEHATLLL